ncbi:hypothetical protein BDC45DRAFT_572874 [Circinella umbellata]|nr:hypothetical protein BDC45DRAFT_572874 [Circinella umbellata]
MSHTVRGNLIVRHQDLIAPAGSTFGHSEQVILNESVDATVFEIENTSLETLQDKQAGQQEQQQQLNDNTGSDSSSNHQQNHNQQDEPDDTPLGAAREYLLKIKSCSPNCGSKLHIDGFDRDPIARRIVDIDRETINDYDSELMDSLPYHNQSIFPAILTHRGGISRQLADLLRPCFQNAMGPERNGASQSHPSFSNFDDQLGYAGYVPSATYLRMIYTAIMDQLRLFMDKSMMVLDGVVLKGDHTFKIINHMANVGGESTFYALYTIFEQMLKSYHLYGPQEPQILYTDYIAGDKRFL